MVSIDPMGVHPGGLINAQYFELCLTYLICRVFSLVYISTGSEQKMAEEKQVPLLLEGKFFTIVSVNGDKVVAKCVSCVSKTIAGGHSSTSNFRLHLKVGNIILGIRYQINVRH